MGSESKLKKLTYFRQTQPVLSPQSTTAGRLLCYTSRLRAILLLLCRSPMIANQQPLPILLHKNISPAALFTFLLTIGLSV